MVTATGRNRDLGDTQVRQRPGVPGLGTEPGQGVGVLGVPVLARHRDARLFLPDDQVHGPGDIASGASQARARPGASRGNTPNADAAGSWAGGAPDPGHLVRSAGTRRGVTASCEGPVAARASKWGFRMREVVCEADTGPVIGAEFAAVLARAQGRDEEAFTRLFRDVQPALLRYLRVTARPASGETARAGWGCRRTGGGDGWPRWWTGQGCCTARSGPDTSHGEMPGFSLPSRQGRELGEPVLDALLDGQSLLPDAPEQAGLVAEILADLAGPAEPGELAGETAARLSLARCPSPAGISPATRPPAPRKLLPPPVPRAGLAGALVAVAARLGPAASAHPQVPARPAQH